MAPNVLALGHWRHLKFKRYIFERVLPLHRLGLGLGVGVCLTHMVVGEVDRSCALSQRDRQECMTTGDSKVYLHESISWLCMRQTMLVVYASLLALSFVGSGNMYERFFPWACEAGNLVGFLARHAGMLRGIAPTGQAVLTGRASIDMWHRLRPATVIGSVISMRYELESQWPCTVARFALEVPLNIYRRTLMGEFEVFGAFGVILPELPVTILWFAVHTCLHAWIEASNLQMFLAKYTEVDAATWEAISRASEQYRNDAAGEGELPPRSPRGEESERWGRRITGSFEENDKGARRTLRSRRT